MKYGEHGKYKCKRGVGAGDGAKGREEATATDLPRVTGDGCYLVREGE